MEIVYSNQEQELAYDKVKRLVLAWDPDFTRLTPAEEARVQEAEEEYQRGEVVPDNAIDWDDM